MLIESAQGYIPAEAVAESTALDRETSANTWPKKRIHFIPYTSEGQIRLAEDYSIRTPRGTYTTLKAGAWISLERAPSPELPALIRVE